MLDIANFYVIIKFCISETIMTEKVLVNRQALDKLLQYVYRDEERD